MRRARGALSVTAMLALALPGRSAHAQDSTGTHAESGPAASIELPLGVGFRLPTYDRVNGVTLPWGPRVDVGDGRLTLDPTVAYRSNLGKFDPALSVYAALTPDSALALTLSGARGSFTNDAWIRSDIANSLVTLGLGHDSRNWFRGDRGEARLVGRIGLRGAPDDDEDDDGENTIHLFVGARTERDWSTGWRPPAVIGDAAPPYSPRGPWSFFNRSDSLDGMTRPNPAIDAGHITSGLLGARLDYRSVPLTLLADVLGEGATSGSVGGSFRQVTFDGHTEVATFAGERIEADGHLVTTSGGVTPRQRYAYVGGSGTLATVDLLQLGGDHLYFLDTRYVIPIPGVDLPFAGQPYFAPHFASGAASVGGYGRPVQNVGFRVGLGPLTFDAVWNPRSHAHDIGFGLSLSL